MSDAAACVIDRPHSFDYTALLAHNPLSIRYRVQDGYGYNVGRQMSFQSVLTIDFDKNNE